MSFITSLLAVVLSAVSLSLGIPNELFKMGSALFGLVALVPLYLALAASPGWRRAGVLGGVMMSLVHLLSSFWLANFKDFAIFTIGASTLFYGFLGILPGWLLRHSLRYSSRLRPFLFATTWTLWEWFKSNGFFAYPWGTLVMSSRSLSPLIQISDLTGTWGISFLFALVSATAAEAILTFGRAERRSAGRSAFFRTAAFTAALIVISCAYGAFRLLSPPVPVSSIDVVMVQENADSWDSGSLKANLLRSESLTREAISRAGKKPDLVVWSESAIPWPYVQNEKYYQFIPAEDPLVPFLAETGAPLLAGSPVLVDPENGGYSNAVILLSPEGKQTDWYGKIQLVPFAEYLPFTEYAWVRRFFDKIVGFSDGWIPGTEFKTLPVVTKDGRTVHITTPVCFEDAFSSHVAKLHNAGSDLLVNLTNDSWSKTESAEYQHFTIASFRTIELRTTMIRSTNGGYSVVIDALGRVIADMPLFVADSTFVTVPLYAHRTTFYARFGDWFPAALAFLVLLVFALRPGVDRRNKRC